MKNLQWQVMLSCGNWDIELVSVPITLLREGMP